MARPREFDPDDALRSIQRAFWTRGYHGTSMQDIERATSLKKQSLYREFGNKEDMYARSLKLYRDRDLALLAETLLRADNARQRFKEMFAAALEPVKHGDRSGCFLCNSAIDRADEDFSVREYAMTGIADTLAMFEDALTVSEPYASDPELCHDTALFLTSGYFGLRVMVRSGTPLEKLQEAVTSLTERIAS